jgi:hypothetical protein
MRSCAAPEAATKAMMVRSVRSRAAPETAAEMAVI